MKKAWILVLSIVGVALAAAALCIIVGMITGAELERIYSVFENYFEVSYNINLDELIHSWIPQVLETVDETF